MLHVPPCISPFCIMRRGGSLRMNSRYMNRKSNFISAPLRFACFFSFFSEFRLLAVFPERRFSPAAIKNISRGGNAQSMPASRADACDRRGARAGPAGPFREPKRRNEKKFHLPLMWGTIYYGRRIRKILEISNFGNSVGLRRPYFIIQRRSARRRWVRTASANLTKKKLLYLHHENGYRLLNRGH